VQQTATRPRNVSVSRLKEVSMKKALRYPRQHLHPRAVLRFFLTVLTLATAGSAYNEVRPSPHELGTIATTSGPRLWFPP